MRTVVPGTCALATLSLLLLLVVPVAARAEDPAQPAGTEPVAAELLKGRSLVLEQGNCSVDAPGGFEWLASPGMTEKHPEVRMFLCRDGKQSQIFMLQVYDKVFATLDAKGMDEFLTGAQGSMEQQGWKFQKKDWKPAKIPLEGSSYRFTVQLLRKDGQTLYWIGYVSTAQRMYCLSSMQLEDGERPEFNSFVKSFKLLKPVSSPGRVGSLLPYIALSFIVGSVVVFVNSKRQKKDEAAEKAKGGGGGGPASEEDDEDDVTDAFKVQPIIPSGKGKTRRDVEPPAKEKTKTRTASKPTKPETRRDERPAKPRAEDDRRERRDERSDRGRDEKSDRGRDEKSDRGRERPRRDDKNERPFG